MSDEALRNHEQREQTDGFRDAPPDRAGWWLWLENDEPPTPLLIAAGSNHCEVADDGELSQALGRELRDGENYWEGTDTATMGGRWKFCAPQPEPPTVEPPATVDAPTGKGMEPVQLPGDYWRKNSRDESRPWPDRFFSLEQAYNAAINAYWARRECDSELTAARETIERLEEMLAWIVRSSKGQPVWDDGLESDDEQGIVCYVFAKYRETIERQAKSISDQCEDDTALRELARSHLGSDAVDGDGYAVPPLYDVIRAMEQKLRKERDELITTGDEPGKE